MSEWVGEGHSLLRPAWRDKWRLRECLRILHVIEILSAYSGVNQVPETVLSNFDGFWFPNEWMEESREHGAVYGSGIWLGHVNCPVIVDSSRVAWLALGRGSWMTHSGWLERRRFETLSADINILFHRWEGGEALDMSGIELSIFARQRINIDLMGLGCGNGKRFVTL